MHVKKGDNVRILTGKDRGKTGKVLRVLPKQNKVIVEDLNIAKRHQRARSQQHKGGVIEKAMPIHASNVAMVSEGSSKTKKQESKKK